MSSNFFTSQSDNTEKRVVLSVSDLNSYVERLLSGDSLLHSVSCEGEISGFKRYYSSGHCYFTLKDENAAIACVMFRGYADNLKFTPRDGMRVVLSGYVSLYAKDGRYQFYAQGMHNVGEGELYAQFAELKEKLEKEGLFSEEHKKAIPLLPRAIGVVTSRSGAVFHDILNVSRRRFPDMHIILSPCSVQGKDAPAEICSALSLLDKSGLCDVIIVGRGGGSMEDLWCFNDERVARTIYECETPVISAVGHETDFTIADFAADMRAPTPSAAAELAVPLAHELEERISALAESAESITARQLDNADTRLLSAERVLRDPDEIFGMREMMLFSLEQRAGEAMTQRLKEQELKLKSLLENAESMSPYSVLMRGYAMIKQADGKCFITDTDALKKAGRAKVVLNDGETEVVVSD